MNEEQQRKLVTFMEKEAVHLLNCDVKPSRGDKINGSDAKVINKSSKKISIPSSCGRYQRRQNLRVSVKARLCLSIKL